MLKKKINKIKQKTQISLPCIVKPYNPCNHVDDKKINKIKQMTLILCPA